MKNVHIATAEARYVPFATRLASRRNEDASEASFMLHVDLGRLIGQAFARVLR